MYFANTSSGRCTSAAPWYFKLQILRGVGTFQDGGLQHNMPMDIACWEKSWLWPEKGEPDYGLSLGTGTGKLSYLASKFTPQSPVKDRFHWRLLSALSERMDAEREWWRFYNSLSPKTRQRFLRLNVKLKEEPKIDDTSAFDCLKAETRAYLDNSQDQIQRLVDAMIASLFYFELEEVPRYTDGVFFCSGHIYCRLNLSQKGQEQLYCWMIENSAFFLINGRPVPCTRSIPKGAPAFRCRIQFSTRDLEEELLISIRGVTSQPKLISGLPRTVSDLIDVQSLYAPFGRSDYQTFDKALPSIPLKRKIDIS